MKLFKTTRFLTQKSIAFSFLALAAAGCGDSKKSGAGASGNESGSAASAVNISRGERILFSELPDRKYTLSKLYFVGIPEKDLEMTTELSVALDPVYLKALDCKPNKAMSRAVRTKYRYVGVRSNYPLGISGSFERRSGKTKILDYGAITLENLTRNSSPNTCEISINNSSSSASSISMLDVFMSSASSVDQKTKVQTLRTANLPQSGYAEKINDSNYLVATTFQGSTGALFVFYALYQTSELAPLASPTVTPSPTPTTPALPRINLERDEEQVVQTVTQSNSNGMVRDGSGQIKTFQNSSSFVNYASSQGFNTKAAEDAYTMSSKTDGFATLAPDSSKIEQATLDMFAHMKNRINRNSGNLEVVFVLDYSGSMWDDIRGVISGLDSMTKSLEAVQRAGRSLRVGIVTFGEQYREKVELQPTADFNLVRTNLSRLLREYPTNQHSTDPGEACYLGINCAATQVSWSYDNRMAIVITDEPSWEISNNRQDLVDQAIRNITRNAIEAGIYTIVTK